MPFTPLHAVVAYLLNRWQRKLSLPALIVGTMVSDLEIPFVWLVTGGLYGRLVLHSLLGAAVLGTLVAVLLTLFAYPTVVSSVFRLIRRKLKRNVVSPVCLCSTVSSEVYLTF